MPQIGFEVPPSVGDVVSILNRTRKWNLTLIDTAGRIYGHYQANYGQFRETHTGSALLYNGDVDGDGHPIFVGETDEAAAIFLYGLFLGHFEERSLESIQDETTHRPEHFV